MNKYSLKILDFLNTLNQNSSYNFKSNLNKDHNLINTISSIAETVLKINIPPKSTNNVLPKINSEEYPLLYIFFKEYFDMKGENKFKNFPEFINWYNISQHTLSYDKIFRDLQASSKVLDLYKKIFTPEPYRERLHKVLYQNNFVGLDITQYVEMTELSEIRIESDRYDLCLYLEKDYQSVHEGYTIRVIRIIELMFKINDQIIKQTPSKLKINVVFTKQPKRIPLNNFELLGPININSGSSIPTVNVNVWRTEEFEKVLIHELQHFLGCDFNRLNRGYSEITKTISNIFNIIGEDRVNEAYNETMAHIISMCYNHKVLHIDLVEIYHYEMFFSLFQTAKILNHFGANSISQIMKNTNTDNIYIRQTTSVISYYIIKSYMLFNINQTLDLITKFNFQCNDHTKINILNTYLQQIFSNTNLDVYITELIKEIRAYPDKNKFIMRTLRMTAIESK